MAPPGRRRAHLSPATVLFGLFILFSSTASAASAVIGVDLGTEYIKATLVKPGIPLEIVLTKDSKRKETAAIAFKPSKGGALPAGSFPERFYGGDAIALQGRFPGEVYPNLKQLLGVSSDNDAVSTYKERYPALEVTGTEGRPTVSFQSGTFVEDKSYTVEELLAMELKSVRENAKSMAGKGYDVQEAVFTIPAFYTVAERRALEVAARLAGLKVLSVVSDGLAVGLNYATGRTFPDITKDGKPEINMIFDMGAGSATATILKFQGRSVKDVGKRNKTIQEVQVMGSGWDRMLGGDALNSLIVEDMISTFVELPAAKSASFTADQVKTHGRTAAKLFKEAERVRQMLSANKETNSFFESFYEDVDFRYKFTRAKFEELAAAYAERVEGPIHRALEAAGLTLADLDSVIVHGGASRTPFVQARLEAIAGKAKIRANVNSDEAAVFGAAFKAASLSPSFRVKEIRESDTQGYNHGYQYMFNMKDRDQNIFTPSTKLGAVKDLPFKMMGEFEFAMYQAVPGANGHVSKEPTLHFQSGNLTKVVTKMIDEDKCDRESFNNYVQVRLSPVTGTPEVLSAWVTCETEAEEPKAGIVDGVKNLFGMGGKKDQEPLEEGESSSPSGFASVSSSSAGAESTDAAQASEKKIKVIRSAITYDVEELGYKKIPRKEFKRMQDRLTAFDASDRSRRAREEVLNSLEAFTYRARDYLEDESFMGASTEAVRLTLEKTLGATSDWLYSEGADADEKILGSKLKELEDIVKPVLNRRTEAAKRPDAIKELKDTIAHIKEVEQLVDSQIKTQLAESSKSSEAVSKASADASASASSSADAMDELEDEEKPAEPEITEVPTIYTESDLKRVQDFVSEAQTWLDEKEAKQSKLGEMDEPALSVKEIEAEKKKLDDVVMDMMMKKAKHFKPPNQQKSKTTKTKSKATKSKKAASKTKKAATKETEKPGAAESQQQVEDMETTGEVKQTAHGDEGPSDEELSDEQRRILKKLDLGEDATEAEILAALDKATQQNKDKDEL